MPGAFENGKADFSNSSVALVERRTAWARQNRRRFRPEGRIDSKVLWVRYRKVAEERILG